MRERIGAYRIEGIVATGGMGVVYKGRHERLDRNAAIKTLFPKDAADAALHERLLREAQALARLKHANIVTVYDCIHDEDTGELFIAMEYIDGATLMTVLDHRTCGPMPLAEALPLFDQVLAALEYVHSHEIVHRDVKPSNVMVCGRDVKLADFGIALLAETPRITASRQLVGSPPYMSPEQLEGKSIDHRTDIYSAALVLYRMLAGRPPFEAKEYLAQIHERLTGPPDLRTSFPELAAGVCEAIGIALRYAPEQRFRSIAAFRNALHDGAAGFLAPAPQASQDDVPTVLTPGTSSEPPLVTEPESRKATLLVILVVAGAFVAASSVLLNRHDLPRLPEKPPAQKEMTAAAPGPIFIEAPAAPAPLAPARREPVIEPRKIEPFAVASTKPAEDPEAVLRRELDALRDEIGRGLARAENELGLEHFDVAIDELDRIAERTQRHPAHFGPERDRIAALRTRVVEARVAAQTRKAQDALWASRLADVEKDLGAGHWPEAERFAGNIISDPSAPETITARARVLLQQAKDGRRDAFKDMQLGPTSNTIRKPSSPPRKDL